MFKDYNLFEMVLLGGVAMYILAFCSILVLAIIIERCWTFSRMNIDIEEFLYRIQTSIRGGKAIEAVALCESIEVPIAAIFKAVLLKSNSSKEEMEESAERQRIEELLDIKRYIWFVGTIGAIAPFIGLFGTVLGIIRAFHNISLSATGGINVVASGISEALIATAGGLVVAIMAVVSYNYLVVKVNRISESLKIYALRLIEIILTDKKTG